MFYERGFPKKATCIEWMPYTKRNYGRVVVCGYVNGIVRFLLLKQDGFHLLRAMKVHPSAITHIRISNDA